MNSPEAIDKQMKLLEAHNKKQKEKKEGIPTPDMRKKLEKEHLEKAKAA